MKRAITLAAFAVVTALVLGMAGCTLPITMNPSSVSDMAYGNVPGKIILVMDKEFTNYHWEGFSGAELRGLNYHLGNASKNLFYDAFRRAADQVTFAETRPAFPITGTDGIVLVVEPRIGGFSEKHSLFIRNADYSATITYRVSVYDRAGKILLEKDYTQTASEMGSADLDRNFAAPAEKAMAQAVKSILADIAKLSSSPKAP